MDTNDLERSLFTQVQRFIGHAPDAFGIIQPQVVESVLLEVHMVIAPQHLV